MVPTHQRLHADDPARAGDHDGLVAQVELAPLDGPRGRVAEGLVDLLEAVEVDDQHGRLGSAW